MKSEQVRVLRDAEAGSRDKSDVLVKITRGERGSGIQINITSKVLSLFGDQIHDSVFDEISTYNLADIEVSVQDQGALDYAIRARVQTAAERAIREEQ